VADARVAAGLDLAMQEKATALLMGTGKYDLVNVRQVQNMALRQCYQFGGKDCVIRAWACDVKG
jgi:hypothetical protein